MKHLTCLNSVNSTMLPQELFAILTTALNKMTFNVMKLHIHSSSLEFCVFFFCMLSCMVLYFVFTCYERQSGNNN